MTPEVKGILSPITVILALCIVVWGFCFLFFPNNEENNESKSKEADISSFWLHGMPGVEKIDSLAWSGIDAAAALLKDDSLVIGWEIHGSHYESYIHPMSVKIKKDGSVYVIGWSSEIGKDREIGIYMDGAKNAYRMDDTMRQRQKN